MFPVLFESAGIRLYSFNAFLAAAFVAGLLFFLRESKGLKLDGSSVFLLFFLAAVSSMAGAKTLYIIENAGLYLKNPSMLLDIRDVGMTFYGGMLGGLLALGLLSRRIVKRGFLEVMDAAAPAVALAQSLGRLGCFAAGCCWGKPANLPWSVTFASRAANELSGVPLGVPVHPVQLYGSVIYALIFAALLFARGARGAPGAPGAGKNNPPAGKRTYLYLLLNGCAFLFLEFFRADRSAPERAVTVALSAAFILASVFFLVRGCRAGSAAGKGLEQG